MRMYYIYIIVVLNLLRFVQCQVGGNDFSQIDNPAVLPFLTQVVYSQLSNLTSEILVSQLTAQSKFCIKDPVADWDRAFNFSSNLTFLSSCIQKTGGDITRRLCTAAEAKFYFSDFFARNTNSLKLNGNCNLTTWVSGCEPGWACSAGPNQDIDPKNSRDIPARTQDCQACCEGFFCPRGITCMIPCPLGSFCPQATLNRSTGVCEPYLYELPPGHPNHTCGGANIWADVARSGELFCSAGSYCPTSTEKIPCSDGHYCRMGSTSENRCFKLTSCDANAATQNIHAYGIMLIAVLVTLLLIIYNCSDQVITTRERRYAKSREAAARSAREKARARERWKSAKDAAKKHASGLQAQFSRTFYRQTADTHSEQLKVLTQTEIETDDDDLVTTPMHPSTSSTSASQKPSNTSGGKGKETSDLMKMMHAIEDDSYSYEGLSVDVGDQNVKRKIPKEKQIHTHSQMFKYAYTQLEKEKALQEQNKNLTFSGVISMATNTEIRKRDAIEISFRDLTLTLKGKNKHLLRCVTGKIKPGRITAVMGPSGAGKTTFLSALAGKAVGCMMTGSILVNGKPESIHSYKKIIGFVPQDDIVHGNLTVEENLWFSARCRRAMAIWNVEKRIGDLNYINK